MTLSCLFCSIAARHIPAAIIHEDDEIMAFLDINPIRPGHSQIIPKTHYAYFEELPADLMGKITVLAQRIARAQKNIYGVERVGFAFSGGDVPHAHSHVVPLVSFDDLTSRRYIVEDVVTYRNPPRPSADEMKGIAEGLRQNLQK
jgi:histidine triad (HIT) family protein